MLNIRDFGTVGKLTLLIIFSILVEDDVFLKENTLLSLNNIIERFKSNIKIGMSENELMEYTSNNGYKIVPKSRIYAAKKINGIDYSFEFFILEREDNDSLKILVSLICKENVRIVNNYCMFFKKKYNDNIKSKYLSELFQSQCKDMINNENERKAINNLDSLLKIKNDKK